MNITANPSFTKVGGMAEWAERLALPGNIQGSSPSQTFWQIGRDSVY